MSPYVRLLIGDVRKRLVDVEDGSVDLVCSSPPFLALRSYLPADHPDKALEMGSEPTPGEYLDALLDVVEDCRRKLAPHGSLVLELGDTYAGSGGAGGDYNAEGLRAGQEKFRQGYLRNDRPGRVAQATPKSAAGPARNQWRSPCPDPRYAQAGGAWPLDKSLCLIPELLRVAMVYGFNPLTGRETPQWRARNVIRWARPNPPVGALADKVRPATSDLIVACVGRKRYFDLDAVRTPLTEPGAVKRHSTEGHNPKLGWNGNSAEIVQNAAGAPPLDHWWHDEVADLVPQDAWDISTQPYKGSHYATWPSALVERLIKLMCPAKVCTTCGKPSERIVIDRPEYVALKNPWPRVAGDPRRNNKGGDGGAPAAQRSGGRGGLTRQADTTGWTDCGHDAWRPGLVLDPFAGSGTTLAAAQGLGRSAIGVDLDSRNTELARQRVGMFLEVA